MKDLESDRQYFKIQHNEQEVMKKYLNQENMFKITKNKLHPKEKSVAGKSQSKEKGSTQTVQTFLKSHEQKSISIITQKN